MNVVDSSGWLEYFADSQNASFFTPAIENSTDLIVPSIIIYEVFKRVLQQQGQADALQALAFMQQGTVVDLDIPIALNAAKISATHQLSMADSIILATSRAYAATLWTQDKHLKDFTDVRYKEKFK